jgi:hypothetical protein
MRRRRRGRQIRSLEIFTRPPDLDETIVQHGHRRRERSVRFVVASEADLGGHLVAPTVPTSRRRVVGDHEVSHDPKADELVSQLLELHVLWNAAHEQGRDLLR